MFMTSLSALRARIKPLYLLVLLALAGGSPLLAQGEAELKLPDLSTALFQGINGRAILMGGLVVAVLGLVFGLLMYKHLRNLPVHESMLEISELIYETCKTYLLTQGKFLLILGNIHRRDYRAVFRCDQRHGIAPGRHHSWV